MLHVKFKLKFNLAVIFFLALIFFSHIQFAHSQRSERCASQHVFAPPSS